jgi:hypothetical protein
VSVRVIAKRPDTIMGFGETRIHTEAATFEVRASEIASPRPGDQLTVGTETFVVRVSRNGTIPTGSRGVRILDLHEIAVGLKAQLRLNGHEESLQFGETIQNCSFHDSIDSRAVPRSRIADWGHCDGSVSSKSSGAGECGHWLL